MKNVVVVGVGALGSHLVQFVRNEDVTLRVIDFDRVEQKNVMSQFHGKTGVGKTKVESLKQTMQFLYGLKLTTVPHKVVGDNIQTLLDPATTQLVVDCLDNGASRRLVQNHIRKANIPCLHGALAPDGSFGRVIWDHQFIIDDESGEGVATCENGEFLPFIAITAAYMARAVQLFLDEKKPAQIGFSISPAGVVRI